MTSTPKPHPPESADALLIHAYVDGELDVAGSIGVRQRIESDPVFAAEAGEVVALKNALREKVHPETVSPAFRARIEALPRPPRHRTIPSWRALAASVVLAMAISSGSTWLLLGHLSGGMLEQMVDSHTRALLAGRPTEVASSDGHVVKPWFNDKLTSAPIVIDLRNDGYPLAGARLDVIAAKPVAALVYNRRLHSISLFERPAGGAAMAPSSPRAVQGLNVVSWRQDDIDYWAVSDLNAKELAEFAELFRKSNGR